MSDPLDVTVVIPTIPPRVHLFQRALASVLQQTLMPKAVVVEQDLRKEGAWETRDRGLRQVRTPWVAFLDDDDEMLPNHLAALMAEAEATDADYVFSYYELIVNGRQTEDTVLGHFGKPWDPLEPRQTTITTLVKTELAQSVGFRAPPPGDSVLAQRYGEDYAFTLGCVSRGALIRHVPQRTWRWHHWGMGGPGTPGNTSGLPDRW